MSAGRYVHPRILKMAAASCISFSLHNSSAPQNDEEEIIINYLDKHCCLDFSSSST